MDPLFVDADNLNFILSSISPCIDAGTTDTNMDGSDDIEYFSGIAPDLGVFEFEEVECGIVGDLNTDGNVNILDIINVANCILSDCSDPCSDLNADSIINILDIINLVNIILNF